MNSVNFNFLFANMQYRKILKSESCPSLNYDVLQLTAEIVIYDGWSAQNY